MLLILFSGGGPPGPPRKSINWEWCQGSIYNYFFTLWVKYFIVDYVLGVHTSLCIIRCLFPSILHHEFDSISTSYSWKCNIELTVVWKNTVSNVNSNLLESLALEFVYCHRKCRAYWKLSPLQSKWHFFVTEGERERERERREDILMCKIAAARLAEQQLAT